MKIIRVKEGGIGDKLGLKPGDRLLKINSKKVKDEIDFRFKIAEEEFILVDAFRISPPTESTKVANELDKYEICYIMKK